jgi:ferredoxin
MEWALRIYAASDKGLCVDECPAQAIFQDEDLPDEWSKYTQINIDYYDK